MSLGPILPGRIPNSLLYSRAADNLNTNTELFLRLQDQIATGQRFQNIGEDPAAAIQTMLLQTTKERTDQISKNVELNRSLLSVSEEALGDVADVFNQMQAFTLAGLGDNVSATEKRQMASEVDAMIQQVTLIGNSNFRGRHLFGGSQNTTEPFSIPDDNNGIRFNGDFQQINSYVSLDNLMVNNVDAAEAFKPLAEVNGSDINPALTNQTRIADLFSGAAPQLGVVEVSVDTGTGPTTAQVDLSNADSIQDLITRLEAPFGGNLTVAVAGDSLQFTPAAGTVAVADLPNSRVAARLGIASPAAASITSPDYNPRLTLRTELSSLNAGTGIGATVGTGLKITNGIKTEIIDLTGLTTIEDLFNAIEAADLDVATGFTDDGQGLRIAGRLSGVDFSIGENGGDNASRLGIRSFSATTSLAQLNSGLGVPTDSPVDLDITRRDGSQLEIDLDGATSVQDVLDKINAVDPGVLVASINQVGNGITINDSSGTGALTVRETSVSVALGMAGTEDGNADLIGTDVGIAAASDLLAALNGGAGAPVSPGTLDITRRDGSTLNVDLSTATTVSDVLTLVNAVDPGSLVLSLDASTGGLRLNDDSGTGPLTVDDNAISTGLGIAGSEDGLADLVGTDPNPKRAGGVLDLLFRLSEALSTEDNVALAAIDKQLKTEIQDFNFQRGVVAGQLKSLDRTAASLVNQDILIQESIANIFDTDMAEAITQFTNLQASIQATQQIAAQTLQLNLFNFI